MILNEKCKIKKCKGFLILAKSFITKEEYIKCNKCNYSRPIISEKFYAK
jgi:hypothetical protein